MGWLRCPKSIGAGSSCTGMHIAVKWRVRSCGTMSGLVIHEITDAHSLCIIITEGRVDVLQSETEALHP